MNCSDFEKAIGAEPDALPESGIAHAASCAACGALLTEYRELEKKIAQALDVPVPALKMPALDEIDDNKVVTLPKPRRISTPMWFGLAATVALAAWLGLLLQQPDVSDLPLTEQIIAHMDHETYSRVISDVAVPERTLQSVVSKDVAELDRGVGLISYARSCIINGKSVPHLVLQGENGPITLLLMPDEALAAATPIEGKAINGVMLPVGNGSIAIIVERGEPLHEIEQKIVDSIKWKT